MARRGNGRRCLGGCAVLALLAVVAALGPPGCLAEALRQHRRGLKFLQGLGISGANAEISIILDTNLRGNANEVRNEIYAEMAQDTAYGLAQDLRTKIDAIVSNLIMGDQISVTNLIKILTENSSVLRNVNVTLNNIIINEIAGKGNTVDNLQLVDVLNSSPGVLDNIFANITGIQYNNINGEDNSGFNSLNIEAGNGAAPIPDAWGGAVACSGGCVVEIGDLVAVVPAIGLTLEDVEMAVQASMMNEVARGRGNFLDNFLNVAMFNNVDAKSIKANLEATMLNKVKGFKNDLSNFVDIALGLCKGGVRCEASDFSLDVSTTLLNDITGKRNEILNMVKVAGAIGDGIDVRSPSFDEVALASSSLDNFKKSILDVEALIVNVVKPGGLIQEVKSLKNKIENQVEVEAMIKAKVSDVKVKVNSLISNTIMGSRNYLTNLVKVSAANGGGDFCPGDCQAHCQDIIDGLSGCPGFENDPTALCFLDYGTRTQSECGTDRVLDWKRFGDCRGVSSATEGCCCSFEVALGGNSGGWQG